MDSPGKTNMSLGMPASFVTTMAHMQLLKACLFLRRVAFRTFERYLELLGRQLFCRSGLRTLEFSLVSSQLQEGKMICSRCGDLLIENRLLDWSARWRCLKCGHIQDSISVENHLASQREDLFIQPGASDHAIEQHFFKVKRK